MSFITLNSQQITELADYLLGGSQAVEDGLEYVLGEEFEDGVELDPASANELAGRVFQCVHCHLWVECTDVDQVYELQGSCSDCGERVAAAGR